MSWSRLRAQTPYRSVALGREHLGFTSHLTWWTHLSDWALASPNLGIDVDLRNPRRMNTQSVALLFRSGADSQYRLLRGEYDGSDLSSWSAQLQWRWHFSNQKHPEHYRYRFFAGPYFEWGSDRHMTGGGGVAGCDLPGLSFGNRHFLQFQMSGTAGFNIEPGMSMEFHLGMTYRTLSIADRYWKPDEALYKRNNIENRLAQQQMDTLLERMQHDPVTIYVDSRVGDSILAESVDIDAVRRAFDRQYRNPHLLIGQIEELPENTPLPIQLPGEHNNVFYKLRLKAKDYDSEPEDVSYILPFRVRISGFDEARNRMQSFNDSLRHAYTVAEKRLPALRLKPVDRDSMAESATMDGILELFNQHWKCDRLRPDEVTGLYYRRDSEFEPVSIDQLNRRGTYALGLKFHPQIHETYDTLSTRFTIQPFVDDRDQQMHDRFAEVYNRQTFYVPHPWRNGKEGVVSVDQVIASLEAAGMTGYRSGQIILPDSIHYGRNLATTTYGPVLQPLQFIFVVEDSVGMRQGSLIYEALGTGVDARRATWNSLYEGNDAHGPLVDGRLNDEQQLVVADSLALLESVGIYLANIEPQLQGFRIDEAWVEDYQYTGLHNLKPSDDTPEGTMWTILQFRYRLLYVDDRPRIAVANVAYRIKPPTTLSTE